MVKLELIKESEEREAKEESKERVGSKKIKTKKKI